MTTLDPQILAMLVGTTGVGFLMLLAGVEKHALEWRRRQRSCPSCGRHIEQRVCAACTSD